MILESYNTVLRTAASVAAAVTTPITTATHFIDPYTSTLRSAIAPDGPIVTYARKFPLVETTGTRVLSIVTQTQERLPSRVKAQELATQVQTQATDVTQGLRKRYVLVDRAFAVPEQVLESKAGEYIGEIPGKVFGMPSRIYNAVTGRIRNIFGDIKQLGISVEARLQPWLDSFAPVARPYAQKIVSVGARIPFLSSVERYVAARIPIVSRVEAWVNTDLSNGVNSTRSVNGTQRSANGTAPQTNGKTAHMTKEQWKSSSTEPSSTGTPTEIDNERCDVKPSPKSKGRKSGKGKGKGYNKELLLK